MTAEQSAIPLPPHPGFRTFELTMLGRAIGDLDRAAMEVLDSADDLASMLAFLGRARAEWEHLGKTVAAIEARCAGAMRKSTFTDPERGVRATRNQGYRYTWDDRRLMFDVLIERALAEVRANLAHYDGLAGADLDQAVEDLRKQTSTETWALVELILALGRWDPRSTALQERFGWTREDVAQYRKSEPTRRTVKVELAEPGGDDDGGSAGDSGEAGAVGEAGDVREGDRDPAGTEDTQ